MSTKARIRVGCRGFAMAQAAYYRLFDIVEVQQTFYQPPRLETLTRWRDAAPPGFVFTLKAWQLITHPPSSPTYRRLRLPISEDRRPLYGAFQPSAEVWSAWQTTLHSAQVLDARLVLFQTPASFTPQAQNIAQLRGFISRVRPEAGDVQLAWEPRGWPVGLAQDLCAELGITRVVDPFRDTPPPTGLRYFRLHGVDGYGHQYTDAELEDLRGLCQGETWCLFNNRSMAADAHRFQRLLTP